ncbi:protein MpPR5b [Marchantia polymorpha subsp. ruderalis]|uniref:Thaumatin-like protein n=2 Tax=Marchantia polymorpha TaxID=3197 RepID=A0A176WTI6_MARPO|nr:hypothetical protein AXG93_2841s1270 [Marchantia polymorpha subsp. ruderalis]PTQ35765.1 hypothetical protein MARPO_0069s0095 [Marchantia polymorpha]BBN03560.1 hypothetical protein Mp_2g24470 [Marchantia polymorpha subsp. ruderalis]|eukprot:PTQ35765.1 hypothetical protein MARPO_0069s0095 [Marchantia polymorpha]
MSTSRSITTFVVWASLLTHVFGCGINIINRCPYTVTTCAQSNRDQQFKGKLNQYNLGAGQSQYLDFGSSCVWRNGAVWPSVRGKCESAFVPNEANDWDVTNWAELNLNANGLDYYDVSNVVAFTLPMMIRPTNPSQQPSGRQCGSPKCIINDIRGFCKGNNKLIQFPTGALVCQNTDGLAERGPTDGTRIFKNACPDAYSYNFDDDTSVFACPTGTNYEVIFCPTSGVTNDTSNEESLLMEEVQME